MGMPRWLVLVGVLCWLPAEAGRRPYIWSFGTETVPEGVVELEQWMWAKSRTPATPTVRSVNWVWWAPVSGVSQHVEVAVPLQLRAGAGRPTVLDSFELDARVRLKPRTSQDPFQMTFRGAWHQPTSGGERRVDLNVISSWTFDNGAQLLLDVGGLLAVSGASAVGTVDLAGSMPLTDELRLGAELFAELPVRGAAGETPHPFVGPSLEWTRGRFWVTAGVLVGLTPLFPQTPHFMPRLMWAVVL
ncbi:MAG: hypothetical protein FJ086_10165 [Deltaproteobacteria bacterium]|nr:hypothetical protein [Deltaproteobacteria bacterium]